MFGLYGIKCKVEILLMPKSALLKEEVRDFLALKLRDEMKAFECNGCLLFVIAQLFFFSLYYVF